MIPSVTWKHLSIGLMAMLAVGFSFPQAFAHITTSLSHNVGHLLEVLNAIRTDVGAIKAKTDNLPTDPASNTLVNTRSSQASVDDLQADVDAVKAQTDNIPTDPADQSLIDAQLAGIQSDTDDIQTSIADLELGAAEPKTINVDLELSVADGAGISFVILPFKAGVSYSGVLSANLVVNPGNRVSVDCFSTDGIIILKSHENLAGSTEIVAMSDVFACNQMRVSIFDLDDGVDASRSFFRATTQYVENSDIQLIAN
jgi:hypothetical protein